jgi:hypothetical protein
MATKTVSIGGGSMTADSDTKQSIFLSHNRNDKPFVRRIYRELSKRDIRNWFDEAEIFPGDSLIEKIEQGITAIDYLAVFLSPDSVKSAWVKKEVSIALTREIAGHRVKVVPIMIGELRDSDIPAMLADKYYIDFRAPYPFEKGWSELHMLLDSAFADFIGDMIETLEESDESASALEGVLRAAGHDVDGIAKLYKYHQIYKALGIELPDVFDMYETAPEGAVDRLAEDIKRSIPYPLWRYLADPDMLRKILRGFGRDV